MAAVFPPGPPIPVVAAANPAQVQAEVDQGLAQVGVPPGVIAALANEGLTSWALWSQIMDDEIKTMCDLLRKGVTGVVPGIGVGSMVEKNLKLFAYYVQHQFRTSRAVDGNAIDQDVLEIMTGIRDAELQRKEDDTPEIGKMKDGMRGEEATEYLQHYFTMVDGEGGIPLAALLRLDTVPLADGEDPDYVSPRAEIIARAPMMGVKFQRNNEKLWDFHSTPAFAWIKAFARRNGKDGKMCIRTIVVTSSCVVFVRKRCASWRRFITKVKSVILGTKSIVALMLFIMLIWNVLQQTVFL
jgi:hypothetical protein